MMERFIAYTDSFSYDATGTLLSSLSAPVIGCTCYLVGLYVLSRVVRKPLNVKPLEIVHNVNLICLSTLMLVGVVSGALQRVSEDGWLGLVCTQREPSHIWDGRLGFWTYVFYVSKYYECFDTVLLVLKKKSLLPLHVYHHAIMMFIGFSWFYRPWLEGSWWCAFVNSIIHIAMYTYYLLATLGKKVWWKKYLTTAQIVQFMTGNIFVATYFYLHYTLPDGCTGHPGAALFSIGVNLSFLMLFVLFYRSTYKKKPVSKSI